MKPFLSWDGEGRNGEICIDLTYGNGWTEREIGYTATIRNDKNPLKGDYHYDWSQPLPFPSNFADEIIFDPPFKYLRSGTKLGEHDTNSWGAFESLQDMITSLENAFSEIRRILKSNGHCLFKWGGDRLSFKRALALSKMQCVDSIIRHSLGGKTLFVGWFVLEK